MDFELHRNDLHTSRFLHDDPPLPKDARRGIPVAFIASLAELERRCGG